MQVLSAGEQESLAATPAHPKGLYGIIFLLSVIFHFFCILSNNCNNGNVLSYCCLIPAMYACYLFGNLVEQLWNFAWPAALSILHPSLLPVAVVGFFTKV